MSRLVWWLYVASVFACLSAGIASLACSGAQQQALGPAGVDLGACILETLVPDILAGKPWQTCVDDTVRTCGTDAASVAKIWAAHVKAEIREGKTPPVPLGYEGGTE